MSLLSVITDVVDAVGLPRLAAVASDTGQPARQMLALANEVLDDLARKNWPILEKAFTFNTVAAQADYALGVGIPTDYKRMIQDSMYDTSSFYKVRGSVTASEWQRWRYSALAALGRFTFKVYGQPLKITLSPTPQTVEAITYEYTSTTRVLSDTGVAKVRFDADTDTTVFPEEILKLGLKWKIRHAKGLEYAQAFNDYQLALQTVFAQESNFGDMPVAIARNRSSIDLPDGYVRESGYGV